MRIYNTTTRWKTEMDRPDYFINGCIDRRDTEWGWRRIRFPTSHPIKNWDSWTARNKKQGRPELPCNQIVYLIFGLSFWSKENICAPGLEYFFQTFIELKLYKYFSPVYMLEIYFVKLNLVYFFLIFLHQYFIWI